LIYTSAIGFFGWQRIQRRQTPYVKRQTITLFLVQLFPLFLLPEIFLPWMGYLGAYDAGIGKVLADHLFPSYISAVDLAAHNWPDWGHPRAYWHAYGFILAWPLSVWNVFSSHPMTGEPLYTWLVISIIQTFVIIPWAIRKWGKGAYCGWVCSCGALAETMGDNQRHKMPHGPIWNKLNMLGQGILLVAFIMLFIRIGAWIWPESWMNQSFAMLLEGKNSAGATVNPISWKWIVDILLGGIFGVGLYFKFSGRTWCRFACPLAALMHIYSRFSRFRIFADKNKCISCNSCTSVCHQGIDVMNFANKGEAMEDPQCVRCSACVQTCPTGVLSFGQIDAKTGQPRLDKLAASPVKMAELIEIKNVS
jgi:ferredoxin